MANVCGSAVQSLLCFLVIMEVSMVVTGSFFVSTHQKSRYVKPPITGKRSMAESLYDDPAFPLLLSKNDNLDFVDTQQEKRACRLILKTIDLNVDHILTDTDSTIPDDTKPFQRAIQYVARNLDLLKKCLSRAGDK